MSCLTSLLTSSLPRSWVRSTWAPFNVTLLMWHFCNIYKLGLKLFDDQKIINFSSRAKVNLQIAQTCSKLLGFYDFVGKCCNLLQKKFLNYFVNNYCKSYTTFTVQPKYLWAINFARFVKILILQRIKFCRLRNLVMWL